MRHPLAAFSARMAPYARHARMRAELAIARRSRVEWPVEAPTGHDARVAICFVSYNTRELTSQLLFSLFRILGRERIARVVAVDNASTDGSVELLRAFEGAGLIDAIFNRKQRYHGPAMNQGVDHLSLSRKRAVPAFDYVWILDSDAFVLRHDAYDAARDALVASRAAAVGEFQDERDVPGGYAHVSSLLVDPSKVWRGSIEPFENSGTPARFFHRSVRSNGHRIEEFPFRSRDYVLHLGRGTIKTVVERGEVSNRHYGDAKRHDRTTHHFHGNVRGAAIYEAFLDAYHAEVAPADAGAVLRACRRAELIALPLDSVGA